MENKILDRELNFFNAHLDEFLGKAKGEYALIEGERLIGTFKSREDAIRAGYREFGNSPFLVKQILEIEEVYNFTSNLMAAAKAS